MDVTNSVGWMIICNCYCREVACRQASHWRTVVEYTPVQVAPVNQPRRTLRSFNRVFSPKVLTIPGIILFLHRASWRAM